jgi:acetyl-CoA C-acetyltransferase
MTSSTNQQSSTATFILSAVRTPVASFQGALSDFSAPQLGSIVIKEALRRAGVAGDKVEQVIMGQVLTAGVGQAPARQSAIFAGVPSSATCMTINKVCGSGLKAVMLADDAIKLGQAQVVVAGGQENMTRSPHLLEKSRSGFRMGNANLIDSMIHDGLWDPYNNFHMGTAAELCAKDQNFSREEQDAFAIQSYTKAQKAIIEGAFKNEIIEIEIPTKKTSIVFSTDEDPNKTDFSKIPTLKPAFDKAGTITAANASKINDGAAALVLASHDYVQAHAAKPIAKIISHATFAQDPKWFTTAPIPAMKKAVALAGLKMSDIDLFEINEAFAVVCMAAQKTLEIPAERVNIHGGAVALGHPIGASGARILTTLIHALHRHQKRYGLATLCIGGGEAVALIVERV